MIWTHNITIDTPDFVAEDLTADYDIDATWGERRGDGTCWVTLHSCKLIRWGVLKHDRSVAVTLAGDTEIERQERLAGDEWLETASADEAAEWADHQREMTR